MLDQLNRYFLPLAILVLLGLNTLSTCNREKAREDLRQALDNISEGQTRIDSALQNIKLARKEVSVSLDSLKKIEHELEQTQLDVQKIYNHHLRQNAVAEQMMKEIEQRLIKQRNAISLLK